MNDRGEGVNRFVVDQNVDAYYLTRHVAARLVVERRVALGATLQRVEEVDDHFGERDPVAQLNPLGGEIFHLGHLSAARLAEVHHGAEVLDRCQNRHVEHWFVDVVEATRVR